MGDAAPRSTDSRIGRTLGGRWTLEGLIGVGGTAAVYAARHRNGKRVAVKILHAKFSEDAARVRRFLREGYAANAAGHPCIVSIDDDGVDDGCAFLVMELLTGECLNAKLTREGPLPVDQVVGYADSLLDALATAHDRGVVHRDIKPENLFLTDSGKVKVLDFGIARLHDESDSPRLETRAGAIMGTPAYMAPEQARGRWAEVDARTDLWAVGATLFTLLTGEHVHAAKTPNERLGLAMTTPARSLGTVGADIPEPLVSLVDAALSYEPDERPESAREMQRMLRALDLSARDSRAPSSSSVRLKRPRLSSDASVPTIEAQRDAIPARESQTRRPRGSQPRRLLWLVAGSVAMLAVGLASYHLKGGEETGGGMAEPKAMEKPRGAEVSERPERTETLPEPPKQVVQTPAATTVRQTASSPQRPAGVPVRNRRARSAPTQPSEPPSHHNPLNRRR